jgi:hypothetical protein
MKADRRRSTVVVDTLSLAFTLTVPGTDLVALQHDWPVIDTPDQVAERPFFQ